MSARSLLSISDLTDDDLAFIVSRGAAYAARKMRPAPDRLILPRCSCMIFLRTGERKCRPRSWTARQASPSSRLRISSIAQ